MSFKDHFSSLSQDYVRYRPGYPHELYEYIVQFVAKKDQAWDCATGNGQAAIKLAEYFDRVIATDASSDQIKQAFAHPKVSYQLAEAENSGLQENSCDLVTVAQALHWFDFDMFYKEVRRVTRKEALIAVWTYGLFQFDNPEIDNYLQSFYHDKVGPYWPPERDFIEQKYQTIPFPFDEITTPEFKMPRDYDLDGIINYLGTWSAVKAYKNAMNSDPLTDLRDKLHKIWGDPITRHRAITPLYLRMGRI